MDDKILEFINTMPSHTQGERVQLALVSLLYKLVNDKNTSEVSMVKEEISTPKKTRSKVKKDDGDK